MMLSDLPVGSSGDSGVGGGKPAAPVVVPSPSADVDQVVGKESNNLLLFVCYLYVFNTVYHGLVFELLEKMAERFSEVRGPPTPACF